MIADEEPSGTDEGENYFVSMTDMMVGVLFIFIILLMTFALDFRSSTDERAEALEVAREVAVRLDQLQADVDAQLQRLADVRADRRTLLDTLQDRLVAKHLNVQVDEANGVLRLTEDSVRFPPGGAELSDRNRDNVRTIADALAAVLPAYVSCRANPEGGAPVCRPIRGAGIETLFIEGHTDSTGSDADNWRLSTERAVNTYREMLTVAPALRTFLNIDGQEILSVSGYASARPIDPRPVREAFDRNRRIDLRFVMENDARQGMEQILGVTNEMRSEIDRLRRSETTP